MEPCHCSEGRHNTVGVSQREWQATMQVMLGVSLRARWDATLVLFNDLSVSADQQTFPTLQDISQVTVLQKGEWDRIQYQLRKKQILEAERSKRIAEKQRLYELSQDRAKGWGNTIQVSDHP